MPAWSLGPLPCPRSTTDPDPGSVPPDLAQCLAPALARPNERRQPKPEGRGWHGAGSAGPPFQPAPATGSPSATPCPAVPNQKAGPAWRNRSWGMSCDPSQEKVRLTMPLTSYWRTGAEKCSRRRSAGRAAAGEPGPPTPMEWRPPSVRRGVDRPGRCPRQTGPLGPGFGSGRDRPGSDQRLAAREVDLGLKDAALGQELSEHRKGLTPVAIRWALRAALLEQAAANRWIALHLSPGLGLLIGLGGYWKVPQVEASPPGIPGSGRPATPAAAPSARAAGGAGSCKRLRAGNPRVGPAQACRGGPIGPGRSTPARFRGSPDCPTAGPRRSPGGTRTAQWGILGTPSASTAFRPSRSPRTAAQRPASPARAW